MSLKLLLLWEIILLWHEVLPKVGKILILIREICLGRLIYWLVELQLLLLKVGVLISLFFITWFSFVIPLYVGIVKSVKLIRVWHLRSYLHLSISIWFRIRIIIPIVDITRNLWEEAIFSPWLEIMISKNPTSLILLPLFLGSNYLIVKVIDHLFPWHTHSFSDDPTWALLLFTHIR